MDVFAEGETPTETPTDAASSSAIPDDFPMLAGWPESSEAERRGPGRPDAADAARWGSPPAARRWRDPAHVDRSAPSGTAPRTTGPAS